MVSKDKNFVLELSDTIKNRIKFNCICKYLFDPSEKKQKNNNSAFFPHPQTINSGYKYTLRDLFFPLHFLHLHHYNSICCSNVALVLSWQKLIASKKLFFLCFPPLLLPPIFLIKAWLSQITALSYFTSPSNAATTAGLAFTK